MGQDRLNRMSDLYHHILPVLTDWGHTLISPWYGKYVHDFGYPTHPQKAESEGKTWGDLNIYGVQVVVEVGVGPNATN